MVDFNWSCLDFFRCFIYCTNCECLYTKHDDEPNYQYFVNENRTTNNEILYEADD
jgi:hypothetical protein